MPKATDTPSGNGVKFYYADGQKIPLTESQRFVAVKAADESTAAFAAATAVAERLADASTRVEALRIPDYNIALLKLPVGERATSPTAVMAIRSAIDADTSVASGPPVYEAPGGPEALIPVGEVLVKFRDAASLEKLATTFKLTVKRADYPAPGVYLMTVPAAVDPVETANKLEENPQVEYAEPNFVHVSQRPATVTPALEALLAPTQKEPGVTMPATDPGFASQWNLQKIQAPAAWDITTGSSSIAIAIVDEGCDLTHEDIAYKLPGYDAYAGDNDPSPNGNDAHGTACAGVAAMKMNNGKGGAGIAPGCVIMPIRIAQGIGGGYWATDSAKIADGIHKAVDAPRSADVLSNSYQVGASTSVTQAFQYAQTSGRAGKGCPIAAAAGNTDGGSVIYPANLSPTIRGMMAVSATNEWDQRKSKTSLDGENWWGSCVGPEVDCAAPGVHIYATDIMGAAGYSSGNYIPNFNGTSSATPHVAGLMALILSVDPNLRSWEVEDIIKLTALDLGAPGRDNEFGFGRIDCRRALVAASKIWVEVTVIPEFIGRGKECFLRANLRIYNPGINTVRLDALTFRSYNPTWTTEIDRFEYLPNPGSLLAPRTSQDVRLNHILLKANGNQSAWSFRWSANWSYTYWRPTGPSLPLEALDATQGGTRAEFEMLKGGQDGGAPESTEGPEVSATVPGLNADSVVVDRQTRSITITIR
jgi:thermitase